MLTILAIFPLEIHRSSTRGLVQKSRELVLTSRNLGFNIDAVFVCSSKVFVWSLGDPFPVYQEFLDKGERLYDRWYRTVGFWKDLHTRRKGFTSYNVIWSRVAAGGNTRISFFKYIKRQKLHILLDIPTYPIVNEQRHPLLNLFHRLLSNQNKLFLSLADRIITTSLHTEILGIPTLNVTNGVAEAIFVHALPRVKQSTNAKEMVFFGVAQWNAAHGLDRFLIGAANSSQKHNIRIELAGNGPEVPKLKALGHKLELTIEWLGDVYGDLFWKKLSHADAGIGSLGDHRSGVKNSSSMKHLCYAAASLPFVCDVNDHWADHTLIYQAPADESPIDFTKVIKLVKAGRASTSECKRSLQDTARELTWDRTYENVFNYFRSLQQI